MNNIVDKRQAILKAALKLFTDRGFHNTPTSLIAKEAGVATGTLFHHFKNKEILINELYLSIKKDLLNILSEKLCDPCEVDEKIKIIWKHVVQWGIMHPNEFQFTQQFANSTFITTLTREQAKNQFEFIYEIYEKAVEKNILKSVCREFVMDYFEGMVNIAIKHFRTYPDHISEDNLNELFNVFWYGIAKQ